MGDKKMAKLEKFSKEELLDMVESGAISIPQYYDYKRSILRDSKDLQKRKSVLKSQVRNICKKPRDRKVSFGKFWTATGLGIASGAIAGTLLAGSDASTVNLVVNGVAGGLIGEAIVGTGTFLYATKLISNKVNDYRVRHKKQQISEIGNEDKNLLQKFNDLQSEEEKRDMQDLTIEL